MVIRAVSSVLNQSFKDVEVIVVNDSSADNTAERLEGLRKLDSRVRILTNEVSRGACFSRNRGAYEARSKLLTFLDDDDEFDSSRLQQLLAGYDDKWAYITSGLHYIHRNGRPEIRIPQSPITFDSMLYKTEIGINALVSKSKFASVDGFDESLTSSQDHDMWLRMNLKFGDALCLQDSLLIMHTEHEKPRITQSARKIQGYFRFYRKHKHMMSKSHKAYHLFKLKSYSRKNIPIITILYNLPYVYWLDVVKYYLGLNFPNVRVVYDSFRKQK